MSEDVMSVFNEIYEKQIVPLIIPVEKSRIQFLRRMFTSELFLILTTLLAAAGCCKTTEYFGVAFLMLCLAMITFSFAVVLPFSYMREFSQKFKRFTVQSVIDSFGNITYSNFSNISDEFLRKSLIINPFNSRLDDDCFEGWYKKVFYTVAESNFIGGHGKHTYTFSYVLILFKFNKPIGARTIIADIDSFNKFLMYGLSPEEAGLKEIKLEDVEFAKRYKAFSEDDIEGRYLITPAFMERFKQLRKIMKAPTTRCSFFDNYLLFAIPTFKNRFELANIFYTLKNPKRYLKFFQELAAIFAVIDCFKLDEKAVL